MEKTNQPTKRIVDRLDLQILLAVVVMFVSSWIFLNSIICHFTNATPYNVQLSYILVQYIVTLYLFLCLYLSSIKGRFIFFEDRDISITAQKWINVFMQSWLITAVLCILSIIAANICSFSWVLSAYVFILISIYYLRINCFSNKAIVKTIISICILFPCFISFMTLSSKDVVILHDKDYYSLTEKALITTQVNGYACEHEIFGLQKAELYPNSEYLKYKNMILVDVSNLRDNRVSVGIIGPIQSLRDVIAYPLCKITNIKYTPQPSTDKFTYYQSVNINVKP